MVINMGINDERGHGDHTLDEGGYILSLQKQFPDSDFLTIRGSSNLELYKELRRVSRSRKAIDGMLVLSHGNSEQGKMLVLSEDNQFLVDLLRSESVSQVFQPLNGRFSMGAKIIFSGCSILKGHQPEDLVKIGKQIAENLGLFRGSLYLNYAGRYVYHQEFLERRMEERSFFNQIMTPVAALGWPVLALIHLWENWGYTIDIGPKSIKVFQDRYYHTLESSEPYHNEPLFIQPTNSSPSSSQLQGA